MNDEQQFQLATCIKMQYVLCATLFLAVGADSRLFPSICGYAPRTSVVDESLLDMVSILIAQSATNEESYPCGLEGLDVHQGAAFEGTNDECSKYI